MCFKNGANKLVKLTICGVIFIAFLLGSASSTQANSQLGKQMVDFSFPDTNQKTYNSDKARLDKIYLMKFGQLTCIECTRVLKVLGKLDREYQKKGVVFVDISFDDEPSELKRHAIEHGVDFPTVIDKDLELADYYEIERIPVLIIADKSGKILRYSMGYVSEETIRHWLDSALKENKKR